MHRLGVKADQARPMLIKFRDLEVRDKVWKMRHLKFVSRDGTVQQPVFLEPERTKMQINERKQQMQERNENKLNHQRKDGNKRWNNWNDQNSENPGFGGRHGNKQPPPHMMRRSQSTSNGGRDPFAPDWAVANDNDQKEPGVFDEGTFVPKPKKPASEVKKPAAAVVEEKIEEKVVQHVEEKPEVVKKDVKEANDDVDVTRLAEDFQQSVATTEASTPVKPPQQKQLQRCTPPPLHNNNEEKSPQMKIGNQGNLTAEQLRIIAMNSSNPQQVMSTNGDQSQLLKQLVMSSAANFNNFPQTTTQTSNMNQGLLPTSSSSMYNLSTSMNNSLQQLNTSQHLNTSIPNTFNNPAQIPTSVRQSSSSPQNLPDLNNVVNSLLKDTEEKPTPVTMQDQLNNSVNQLNTSAVNQLNTSALNNSVNQLNNSALNNSVNQLNNSALNSAALQQQINSSALQQMTMKEQMLVKQKMMEMLSQSQQAVDRMMQNSQDESARIEALSQQQQLFQQQLQQQQVKWFYRDPQGHIQGVFSKEQMSEWHSAGYFKNDLELRVEVGSKVCHVTLGQ